jgi:hypothetical protein
LNQRELLFEFQFGSGNSSIYIIKRLDIILFWIWVLLGSIGACATSLISVITILKHSEVVEKEKIDADMIRLKSRPTILQDKPPVELKEIEHPE